MPQVSFLRPGIHISHAATVLESCLRSSPHFSVVSPSPIALIALDRALCCTQRTHSVINEDIPSPVQTPPLHHAYWPRTGPRFPLQPSRFPHRPRPTLCRSSRTSHACRPSEALFPLLHSGLSLFPKTGTVSPATPVCVRTVFPLFLSERLLRLSKTYISTAQTGTCSMLAQLAPKPIRFSTPRSSIFAAIEPVPSVSSP